MVVSARTLKSASAAAIGMGALAGATLFGAVPAALADPPNCTAADIAGVSSGVSASMSTYLFAHPDVNGFFSGMNHQPKNQIRSQVQAYMAANPQVQSDLSGIRQPLVDIQNRCGQSPLSAGPAVPP
jgi:hemophore-related protein